MRHLTYNDHIAADHLGEELKQRNELAGLLFSSFYRPPAPPEILV
jgi:hypothetical protein